MSDWPDHMIKQYEEQKEREYTWQLYEDYMAQNCTCDRSEDDCEAMTFEQFEANYIKDLQDQWAEEAWYIHQEKIECQN